MSEQPIESEASVTESGDLHITVQGMLPTVLFPNTSKLWSDQRFLQLFHAAFPQRAVEQDVDVDEDTARLLERVRAKRATLTAHGL